MCIMARLANLDESVETGYSKFERIEDDEDGEDEGEDACER